VIDRKADSQGVRLHQVGIESWPHPAPAIHALVDDRPGRTYRRDVKGSATCAPARLFRFAMTDDHKGSTLSNVSSSTPLGVRIRICRISGGFAWTCRPEPTYPQATWRAGRRFIVASASISVSHDWSGRFPARQSCPGDAGQKKDLDRRRSVRLRGGCDRMRRT